MRNGAGARRDLSQEGDQSNYPIDLNVLWKLPITFRFVSPLPYIHCIHYPISIVQG